MRIRNLVAVCVIAVSVGTGADAASLFNGKDFSGWYTYVQGEGKDRDATHVFSVDDGTIHVYKTPPDGKPKIGYIATKTEHSNYRLRFQYKWGVNSVAAKRNAGLLYHITGDDSSRSPDVWPTCVQCQVAEKRTGEIVLLGTSVTTTIDPEKSSPTYKEGGKEFVTPKDAKATERVTIAQSGETDGWNTVEVEVRGDAAVHIVNGKPVARFIKAVAPSANGIWTPLTKGRIGFQAEGYEVSYRKIELEPLDEAKPAAAAVEPAAWEPLFNGNDLTGWYTYLKGLGKNNDPQKVFQVHDGTIHIYKDPADGADMPFGYLCMEKDYGDCRIRFEYKWGTKRFGSRATKRRDSGFLYHVFGEDGPGGKVWPASVECQIQENDVGDVYAINTIASATVDPKTIPGEKPQPTFMEKDAGGVPFTTRGSGNDRLVRSVMLEKDGWNTIEVELRGDSAVHIINGRLNMRIDHILGPASAPASDRKPLTRGRILFQAEGAEVMYRNVQIQPLQTAARAEAR